MGKGPKPPSFADKALQDPDPPPIVPLHLPTTKCNGPLTTPHVHLEHFYSHGSTDIVLIPNTLPTSLCSDVSFLSFFFTADP